MTLSDPTPDQQTAAAAAAFGHPLSAGQASRLARLWALLLEWNRRINLTGARSVDELIAEHLPDALALSRLVEDEGPLLDVGAGGGLPALPLVILRPDVHAVLVEPRAKRCAFLRTAQRTLDLPVEVRQARLEAVEPQGYGTVSARAVWPPDQWMEHARRFAEAGSRVVVFLGEGSVWAPPRWARVVDEVRYSAGPNQRLALALTCST